VYYDHLFEELSSTQTRLIFVIEASGFGVSVLGRLFAKIYSRSLDRAIPLLVEEMNQVGSVSSAPLLTTGRSGV
jgi:hypothetical protein